MDFNLKKCPFCGREPMLFVYPEGGVCVKCYICGGSTSVKTDNPAFPQSRAVSDVINAWNMRAPEKEKKWMELDTLDNRDNVLQLLWNDFEDVPMDPETECIEESFLGFPVGTHREDIWAWFDDRYSRGVAYLLHGEGVDRTDKIAGLAYCSELCYECDSMNCAYNSSGECRYPMVHERLPNYVEGEGCTDSVIS